MATPEAGDQSNKTESEVDKLPSKDEMSKMSHSDLFNLRDKYKSKEAQDIISPFEHRAFAREYVEEHPVIGTIGMAAAIPLYQAAKALGKGSRTGVNTDQIPEGYKGVGEGLKNAILKPWERLWNDKNNPTVLPQEAPKTASKPWEKNWAGATPATPNKSTVEASKGFPVASYLKTLEAVESNNNPEAKNPKSSAAGPYQFTASTWNEMVNKLNLDYTLADRTDPKKAKVVAEAFTKQKVEKAREELGREPTQLDVYMYHLLGNAKKFLTAPNDGSAEDYVTKAASKANRNIFFNSDGTAKTVKEVKERFAKKFGEKI